MRTTADIPESLLRQAKARAALEGMRMADIVAQALRSYLRTHTEQPQPQ